jgi:hypothetical protein
LFSAIILGGALATYEAGQIAWLAIAGKRVTAHITHVDQVPPASQAARRYGITYAFDQHFGDARTPRTGYGWVDLPSATDSNNVPETPGRTTAHATAPIYHEGDLLVFRYATLGGRVVMHPWSTPPYGKMVLLAAIGITLMTVGAVFLRRLDRWHRRRMRLLRHGIAVTGSVVSKRVDGLEGKYYLTYSYLVRNDAAVREREEQCTPGQWKLFNEQDPVTVLYDPDKVECVGLYKLLADP